MEKNREDCLKISSVIGVSREKLLRRNSSQVTLANQLKPQNENIQNPGAKIKEVRSEVEQIVNIGIKKENIHNNESESNQVTEKINCHSLATSGKLADTTDKIIENQSKLLTLQHIEIAVYKSLLRKLVYKKTAEETKDLVIILNDLGYLTTKLGELNKDTNYKLKYYTDAALFYQYVISIINKNDKNKKLSAQDKEELVKDKIEDPYQQLDYLQQLIFSAININRPQTSRKVDEELTNNKAILAEIRKDTEEGLRKAENNRQQAINNQEEKQQYQKSYVKEVRKLFESIASKMRGFLAKIYCDSEHEIGTPPCNYAVIGLGSMALKQMTPYSDLEFAILTENENYKQSDDPKIREYFKTLSHLAHFKVINLGESIIPTSKYGLDMSHLVHRAVNFDLGGKTPLGRRDQGKPYELIKTIDWMLNYVRNDKDKTIHIDKVLPYILEKVCYVYGEEKLVQDYQAKVTEFLSSESSDDNQKGMLNCQIRAIKILIKGAVELDYLNRFEQLEVPKETQYKGDLDKLQPRLFDTVGRLIAVKEEIYRLLDRMVYNLGLYYSIEGDSAWDTVDKLEGKGIINSLAALNLKNATTFATTLRLKTYSLHKAQKEDMSIFVKPDEAEGELKEQDEQIFYLSEEDLGEKGELFRYFYTALPLHEKLKDFCDKEQKLSNADKHVFFKSDNFYDDDFANKGLIYHRLAQYKKAQNNLEIALDNPNNRNNLQIRNALGRIYKIFGNGDKAIEQFEYCLKRALIHKDQPHPNVARSLNNIGTAYSIKGEYDRTIKYYQKSLEVNKHIHEDQPHPDVASILNNLGTAYRNKGKFDQAIKYYKESLEMNKLIHKDQPHSNLAGSLNSLGNAYCNKGKYDRAIKYYEESLEMNKLIHKDQPHSDIASSLNNLGTAYKNKGEYDQAIKYYEESLEIKKLIHKDQLHPDVASSLNNLGNAYSDKGEYERAIKYHQESLEMNKLIHKDQPHPDVARSLNNLGNAYGNKGEYDRAIKYYEESLEINKLIHKNQPHPDVATTLNNLGNGYGDKGEYDRAIKYYKESLEMNKLIHKDQPHPVIASTLNNLGTAFSDKGEHDWAIKYYQESLEMSKLIHKDQPHPDVVSPLNNLGNAYSDKGEYERAIKHKTQALQVISAYQNHRQVNVIINSLIKITIAFANK
ncbi:uncharacterized protein LOC105846128, partial [Hydra vulgaris]|uniref:uncharacterized protein LOC105846128 n=1 Tax=Hydra vulgaris TaxID=6087 RepID=UPI0032EA5F15